MPPIPGHWHSLIARHAKVWKAAWKEASKVIETKINNATGVKVELQPVLARNPVRQPLHPAARLRQTQSRWYTTKRTLNDAVRRFTTTATQPVVKYDRASFPKSITGSAVNRSAGRAPFASTLRPNLTGGTLGRTAGGYGAGAGRVGGARYFSHGPAAQAQVVQNVGQAVRAFFVSGQKAQYSGTNPRGEKQYKAVTELQHETGRKMRNLPKATPGSHINFSVNPTITALTPMNAVLGYTMANSEQEGEHLNTDGLIDILSVDFSRALKELAAVLNDLKRLSALGDLPITYQESSLRVHFPGCDAETVEALCSELNVQRGVVIEDADFDAYTGTEMALLFPLAPSHSASEASFYDEPVVPVKKRADEIDWRNMLSASEDDYEHQAAYSTQSESGFEELHEEAKTEEQCVSSPSGYGSLGLSSEAAKVEQHSPLEYQGFEGIYRFIEQCDAARR